MEMLMGMAMLLHTARLLAVGFWPGACATQGATAGCGLMAYIGMGGAEGVGIRVSLDQQKDHQMQMPMAKVQMATPIMAAGDVKAQ
jgi:hypothetical protein